MAFIHRFGDFTPLIGQGDMAVLVHVDIAVFAQLFHRHAHARLFKIERADDVDRAHLGVAAA
ncbi:hypothetical protein SDC9_185984 [bioreactor metagenome]|uniref:Uncharacterized protein n=1 Tax=bioreactor metagenome TaxID=1076179 RepID=A0A645HI92_9ZZZZ